MRCTLATLAGAFAVPSLFLSQGMGAMNRYQESTRCNPWIGPWVDRYRMIPSILFPYSGIPVAGLLLWRRAVSATDLALLGVFYLLGHIGVWTGYHRLFSHRSFEARRGARLAFGILGSMSAMGPLLNWADDHRKHHRFSDQAQDPHSPHARPGKSGRPGLAGIWHSYGGWLVESYGYCRPRHEYVKDLLADPDICFVNRTYFLWVLMGLLLPFQIGFIVSGGSWRAGLTAVVWGGFVRVFLNHQLIFTVNVVCHLRGQRPFRTPDRSTNSRLLAVLALGEGWHHNHHAFPKSARYGLLPGQVGWDVSYGLIRLLERVGLASKVQVPTAQAIARKRASPQPPPATDRSSSPSDSGHQTGAGGPFPRSE